MRNTCGTAPISKCGQIRRETIPTQGFNKYKTAPQPDPRENIEKCAVMNNRPKSRWPNNARSGETLASVYGFQGSRYSTKNTLSMYSAFARNDDGGQCDPISERRKRGHVAHAGNLFRDLADHKNSCDSGRQRDGAVHQTCAAEPHHHFQQEIEQGRMKIRVVFPAKLLPVILGGNENVPVAVVFDELCGAQI